MRRIALVALLVACGGRTSGPGGTSANQAVTAPGTYHYICGIHGPQMSGTLVVQ